VCLLSFCLAKNESNKEKDEFFNCSAEKRSLTPVSQFAYHRHALKLLPQFGGLSGVSMRSNHLFLFFVPLRFSGKN